MTESDAVEVECCGSMRKTNHCPQCGKKLLGDNSLSELLMYCLKRRADYEDQSQKLNRLIREMKKRDEEHPKLKSVQKSIDGRESKFKKWDSWAIKLAELLEDN